MKERPILFSAPMVRAILAGTKTQTRRLVKFLQPEESGEYKLRDLLEYPLDGKPALRAVFDTSEEPFSVACPFGRKGDRLWVKETFRLFDSTKECACYDDCTCAKNHGKTVYRADGDMGEESWKPSIFMPRWASRITLEITGIRVERLMDISEVDAMAEGIERVAQLGVLRSCGWKDYRKDGGSGFMQPRMSFASLWESINGPGSWDANPWVWVIEFRKLETQG